MRKYLSCFPAHLLDTTVSSFVLSAIDPKMLHVYAHAQHSAVYYLSYFMGKSFSCWQPQCDALQKPHKHNFISIYLILLHT